MSLVEKVSLPLFERLLGTLDHASMRLGRTPAVPAHIALGVRGEEAAFFYLRRLGYVITARSWRSHRYAGDIDLIGWENDCLCFIEVKTRTTREVATAESAVDEHKRITLRKMARHYLRHLPPQSAVRFDVLAIYFEIGKPDEFILIRSAFGWSEPHPY
jgi:putative endonuclease